MGHTELSVGKSGVLEWSGVVSSGGVSSSQPRKILHSFQYTLLGRAKCRRHAQKHEPQSHTSLLRGPLVTCHTCTYTPSIHTRTRLLFPVTPSTHCRSRSPSHARTITTPALPRADRIADPMAPPWARLSSGRHPDRTLSSEPARLGPGFKSLSEVGESSQRKGPWAT